MFRTILTNIKTKNICFPSFYLKNLADFSRNYSNLVTKTKYTLTESTKILETINDNTGDDLSK